jgi:RimJ/RimL family protein N-acetyltransferase
MMIETERLIIRNFKLTDKNDLCEYMIQRVDKKFENYPDFTMEKAEKEIEFRSQSDEFFAIELKSTGKVIGNIYLGKRDFEAKELGYVLNENYHQTGYGSEAALAAIKYEFANGTRRIYAEASPENEASWRLMEKIGLQREARLRKNVSFHNDKYGNPIYWDTYIYAALKTDGI